MAVPKVFSSFLFAPLLARQVFTERGIATFKGGLGPWFIYPYAL